MRKSAGLLFHSPFIVLHRHSLATNRLFPDMTQRFVTQLNHRAMATEFGLLLASPDAGAMDEALGALEQLDQIEAALSIYRSDSEISRVNREAFQRAVVVSPPTFSLLQRAIEWSERTSGAFDITAGPLVEAWGFGKRQGQKPASDVLQQALQRVGHQNLCLDSVNRTVRFLKPGMSINLGAIGKGDAIDRLAAQLRSRGIRDFLIHGGNSSVLACGDQQPGSGQGWQVGIAHPTKPSRRLAGVLLRDQAIGTSGSGKQFFHHRGQRLGHVIDPRTGHPSGDLLSLTVICQTATDADACATGWFVAGSEYVRARAASEDALAAVMVRGGHRQDDVLIETAGVPNWVPGDEPQEESSERRCGASRDR